MDIKSTKVYLHLHHETLIEKTWDIEERLAYIRTAKPPEEKALRLALIKDVTDLLPKGEARDAYDKAWNAYLRARDAYVKSGASWHKARDTLEKARASYHEAWEAYLASFDMNAWHREVCHPCCPWDGTTIFSRGVDITVLEEPPS